MSNSYDVLKGVSKRYGETFEIIFIRNRLSKVLEIVFNGKLIKAVKMENLHTGDDFYPYYWTEKIGDKVMKYELSGFSDGKFVLLIWGTNFDDLKDCDEADSDDSHSESEADECKISIVYNQGHVKVNEHTILENSNVLVMSETQFSLDIEATLGGEFVKAIQLVHV